MRDSAELLVENDCSESDPPKKKLSREPRRNPPTVGVKEYSGERMWQIIMAISSIADSQLELCSQYSLESEDELSRNKELKSALGNPASNSNDQESSATFINTGKIGFWLLSTYQRALLDDGRSNCLEELIYRHIK